MGYGVIRGIAPRYTDARWYPIGNDTGNRAHRRGAARLLKACFPLSGANDIFMFGQNRKLQPYTLDGMINVALQRAPLSAFCLFPPLAVSSNDVAGSDVVS